MLLFWVELWVLEFIERKESELEELGWVDELVRFWGMAVVIYDFFGMSLEYSLL